MRNPLRPVRLGLLWLLSGIPLENHTAAVQRIDAGHQQHLARLRRPTIIHNTGGLITDPTAYMPHVDAQAAVRSADLRQPAVTSLRVQLAAALEGVRQEYARRWAVIYRPPGRVGPPPGEGVIEGREHLNPHADPRVLHGPGDCSRCDAFPVRQRARYDAEINFTGRYSVFLAPCPLDPDSPLTEAALLPENRPVRS